MDNSITRLELMNEWINNFGEWFKRFKSLYYCEQYSICLAHVTGSQDNISKVLGSITAPWEKFTPLTLHAPQEVWLGLQPCDSGSLSRKLCHPEKTVHPFPAKPLFQRALEISCKAVGGSCVSAVKRSRQPCCLHQYGVWRKKIPHPNGHCTFHSLYVVMEQEVL